MKTSDGSDYLGAAVLRLSPDQPKKTIVLVGCGGTGAWLAPSLARIAYVQKRAGKEIRLVFMDPDTVEEVNLGRQNFCQAEIGRNKAETLAERYGTAWGLDIEAIAGGLRGPDLPVEREWQREVIMVGCVDNARARRHMAGIVKKHEHVWWLDAGNGKDSGQVILGNTTDREKLKEAFPSRKVCLALPAPHLQEPTLLKPQPGEEGGRRMSCAELARRNAQSLAVNQRAAAEAADMLVRMLITGNLKRFAVYFDLGSGRASSRYITPDNVLPKPERKKKP